MNTQANSLTPAHWPSRFPSPAKLNLFLYINGRLPNGYHELQTLFQFIDICDWLTITPRADNEIHITPEIADLPVEQNLIYRAAKLLQQHCQCPLGADIQLEKNLPMGGGIGGGSSNAATALLVLNELWQCGLTLEQLSALGLQLGADVPIFIHGHAAFAEGVGEKLQHCNPPEKYYLLLKPDAFVSTPAVFKHPELPRTTPKRALEQLLRTNFANDCEKVVCLTYPAVEKALQWLLQYAPARLTGTGACVFAEFADESSAQAVFRQKPADWQGFVARGMNVSPLHSLLARYRAETAPNKPIFS